MLWRTRSPILVVGIAVAVPFIVQALQGARHLRRTKEPFAREVAPPDTGDVVEMAAGEPPIEPDRAGVKPRVVEQAIGTDPAPDEGHLAVPAQVVHHRARIDAHDAPAEAEVEAAPEPVVVPDQQDPVDVPVVVGEADQDHLVEGLHGAKTHVVILRDVGVEVHLFEGEAGGRGSRRS